MQYTIPLSYNPIDTESLNATLRAYADKHHNELIRDFEKALSSYTGAPYVLALNSGTAAIHLGLITLGVGAGDEVIVPDFTYVASVNPVLYLNARPVFVDSEPETWGMDPELLEEVIKKRLAAGARPKAIVVVHVYGMPARIEAIVAVANRYGIPVLEDAAEALGSRVAGRHVGLDGNLGILSFNNNKILTTYGGGALITRDEALYRKALLLAEQARENAPWYDHREVGYTYRMSPLNAAAGLSQFPNLDSYLQRRRAIFDQYQSLLRDGFAFVREPEGVISNRWLTTVVLDKKVDVEAVVRGMKEEGIECRHLWRPMHDQGVFADRVVVQTKVSEGLFRDGLSLPSGNALLPDQVEVVAGRLSRMVTRYQL
jgi:dTDP-4-amino-4,6-dideoxygalactose transaminase